MIARKLAQAMCGLAVLVEVAGAAETARVVSATDTREGPGGYYAAGPRLLAGAPVQVVQQRGGWVLTEVQSKRGWIPAYTLDSAQRGGMGQVLRQATKDMLRSLTRVMDRRDRPYTISRATVSIGIRGFSSAYSAHRGQKEVDVAPQLWESAPFDVAAYEAFVASRFVGRDWESLKKRLPLDTAVPLPDPEADKLGAALTSFVARQDGLLRNAALEAYLSQVAALVAESSHAYELPVRVYVLNSAEPKGFVSPNGIVFVSAGALKRMQSEAEFAFFVGHEIAHIAFQHGLKKLDRDDQRVRESDAFDEMEQALGWDERSDDKYVRTSQELSELADQIYEYFQRENNNRDELEADYWGLIYAARAGYVPEAAEALLLRMVAAQPKADSQLLWNGVARGPRVEGCRRAFQQIKLDRSEFRDFDDEFRSALDKKKPAGT